MRLDRERDATPAATLSCRSTIVHSRFGYRISCRISTRSRHSGVCRFRSGDVWSCGDACSYSYAAPHLREGFSSQELYLSHLKLNQSSHESCPSRSPTRGRRIQGYMHPCRTSNCHHVATGQLHSADEGVTYVVRRSFIHRRSKGTSVLCCASSFWT